MKKKRIRINFFDYLYYTIGTGVRGIEILLIPFLWLAVLIFTQIKTFPIAWGILFAVVVGLLDYGIRCIYDKRGEAVRQYFDKTKYGKARWKWLTFMVWLIVMGVLPLLIIRVILL
ncbi:MAG: hypothetical protein J6Y04_06885 [Bacteroidaceae bacterium]|nr:hypothetical protein [Bacteroidaceae bacterium]